MPSVDAGKHQVEDAHVGALVTEPGEARLPVRHADRVEARRLEMASHPARDDVVVLDDQNLRHPENHCGPRGCRGPPSGYQLVTEW
jgi:hypothetical protein